ncbi:hypothetical protein HQQ81_05325 [Microbacteriaceae bacterium VKM Ac-2854]|nr:hypothetical protein [Microbacteriaceae bacterium VKM Ac-2854]
MAMRMDESALTAPVDRAAVESFRAAARARGQGSPFSVPDAVRAVAIGAFAVLVSGFLFGVLLPDLVETPIARLAFPAAAVLIAGFVALRILALRRAAFNQWTLWWRFDAFARANALGYTSMQPDPRHDGAIFALGRDRAAHHVFRSTSEPVIEIANYSYVTTSDDNETTHVWGYLALKLERRLPHLVLDARSNDSSFFGIRSSNLPASFAAGQRLSLEGDFDRHFTLYCPTGYERDALYILAPDLMALLIDETGDFDVEIVDDTMFVYSATAFDLQDPALWRPLVRIVDTVGAKTLRQTQRYSDDNVNDRAANIVAAPGRRLRSGTSVLGVVVAIAIIAFALWEMVQGWGG